MPSRHAYADSVYPAAFAAYPVTAALTDGRISPYKRPLPARWRYAPHLRHFCPMQTGMQDNTKLLYFVKNVEDYMHISDLIVTKPGGLTVTESLACSLPMAIYSAFPGQERDNAEFLLNKGAAIMLRKKTGADDIVNLVKDKEKLDEMKEKCRELHRPDSAEKIFRLAQKLCNNSKGGNDK